MYIDISKLTNMEKSKFNQLCEAYDIAQENFGVYKKKCHAFAVELSKELKEYYQVPEQQFSLYKVEDNNNFNLIRGSILGALTLTKDTHWHFGIGLTVCRVPNSYPEELILIHILFRKKERESSFYLKHTYSEQEFEVEIGDKASYLPYLDDLFVTIQSSYNKQIQQFVGEKTTRKLGYIQ